MEENFHLLDLQIAKLTEFGVCMILPGAADLDHLRKSSERLAEQWPILGARISLLVSLLHRVSNERHLIPHYRIISLGITARCV
jgi:hypothetical protein